MQFEAHVRKVTNSNLEPSHIAKKAVNVFNPRYNSLPGNHSHSLAKCA